jgi:hypothetical protein
MPKTSNAKGVATDERYFKTLNKGSMSDRRNDTLQLVKIMRIKSAMPPKAMLIISGFFTISSSILPKLSLFKSRFDST